MREKNLCCAGHKPRKQKIAPTVSAPLHLILQAPRPALHQWRKGGGRGTKLCQICHLSLDSDGLRCKDCGLKAHSHCGSAFPPRSTATPSPPPNSLLTSPSLRSSSLPPPPFEPRIKKLHQGPSDHQQPPQVSTSVGSDQSHRLSSTASTPIQIIIDEVTDTPPPPPTELGDGSQSKTPETMRATSGVDHNSSSEDFQDHHSHYRNASELVEDHGPRGDTLSPKGHQRVDSALKHVDGPLDGALYTLVKPKGPSSADSGISVTVDQMKDLDRLLDALVEDADSIPDIPYHARQDSLPFSYGITDQNALRQNPRTQNPSALGTSPSKVESRAEWTAARREQAPTLDSKQYPPSRPTHLETGSGRNWTSGRNQEPARSRVHDIQLEPRTSTPQYASAALPFYDSPSLERPAPLHRTDYASPANSTSYNSNYRNQHTGGIHRQRSASADGRREDADAWLQRQLGRLQEKRAANTQVRRHDYWLDELKRSFPKDSPRQVNHEDGNEPFRNEGFRPSSASRVYSRSSASTPGFYSSDDEDFETEVDSYDRRLFGHRRVERVHSENAFDRLATTRGGNYLSIGSRSGGGGSDFQRVTPGFPSCPPTPYLNRPISPAKPPRSPKFTRQGTQNSSAPSTPNMAPDSDWTTWRDVPRAQTPQISPLPVFVVESEVRFARDQSSFWYKPNATREETIAALRYQRPGAFLIRNSNSFPGAFGLAIKVEEGRGTVEDSVRHFLIEPTKYGVRLRGSAVEPVFSSLSALVYAHSIETLALPTTLSLPSVDSVLPESQSESTTAHLLAQGAACQLLFLGLTGVERVSGEEAVGKGVRSLISLQSPTVVSLRLSKQGLTLTDVFRQRFFRLHFPLAGISYAAMDPERRTVPYEGSTRRIFGVVARTPTAVENSCVVLAELEEGQPANAIVAFFQRVIAWHAN